MTSNLKIVCLLWLIQMGHAIKLSGKVLKGSVSFQETLKHQTTEKFKSGTCHVIDKDKIQYDLTAPPDFLSKGSCMVLELQGGNATTLTGGLLAKSVISDIDKTYKKGQHLEYAIELPEDEIADYWTYFLFGVINQGWCPANNIDERRPDMTIKVRKCDFFFDSTHISNIVDMKKCEKSKENICEGPVLDLLQIF